MAADGNTWCAVHSSISRTEAEATSSMHISPYRRDWMQNTACAPTYHRDTGVHSICRCFKLQQQHPTPPSDTAGQSTAEGHKSCVNLGTNTAECLLSAAHVAAKAAHATAATTCIATNCFESGGRCRQADKSAISQPA